MATTTEINVNILLHILILFTILTIIFWFVITKIEKQAISNEIGKNIDDFFDKSSQDNKKIYTQIANNGKDILPILSKIYSQPDEKNLINNKWLLYTNILFIIFLVAILVVSLIIMRYSCGIKNFPFWEIFKENLVVFTVVGALEVWFFLNIGMKYIPTKPSAMINNFKDSLVKQFQ